MKIIKLFGKYFLGLFALMLFAATLNSMISLPANVDASDPACECDGKVSSLTLEYLGSTDATVKVVQTKNDEVLFNNTVSPAETFTVTGTIDGTFDNELELYVDNVLNVAIHTSCSKPVEIGMTFGSFEVVDGYSSKNGQLCEYVPVCECSGKLSSLTLEYLGVSDALVKVVQTKNDEILFNEIVSPSGLLTVSGTINGTFENEIEIYVNNVLNSAIHTSCSQTVEIGMLFGSFEIIDGYSYDNGKICVAPPNYNCGYPYSSSNSLTSLEFEKDEVIRAMSPLPDGSFGPGDTFKMWYGADKAMVLGVDQVDVKTSSGTTTTTFPLAPLPIVPGGVIDPDLGTTAMSGDFSGLDSFGRPVWPVLYITDTTLSPNSKDGDWQWGGTAVNPDAVFGTWKEAFREVNKTKNPTEIKIKPGDNPDKNYWDLDGGDPVPAGIEEEYFGTELRWDYDSLGLISGHSYRFQVIVHYGYGNYDGGKPGQGCVNVKTSPGVSDLAIDITDQPPSTVSIIGSDVQYKVTVTNNGPDDANGALVTVDLPGILQNPSWTCVSSAGASCSSSGTGDITDTVDIVNGGSLIYTISTTIDPTTTATILTVPAEVVFAGDPDLSNNMDSDTNTLETEFDIVVDKDSPNYEFVPGLPITYVLTINNYGPSALVGGTVTDNFPPEILNPTWTCVATPSPATSCSSTGSGNISDTVDVEVGGQLVYVVDALIDASATGQLINKVIVDSNDGTVREDDHEEKLTPKVDLAVTNTNGETELVPGQDVTYTMVVSNNGPSDVVGGIVTDILPATLNNATWACVSSSLGSVCGDPSGTGDINSTADLPVGGSVTYTLTATVDPGAAGFLANTIYVDVPVGYIDPFLPNNVATDIDPIKVVTDLDVTKTDNKTQAVAGTQNTYTIVVTNNGPSDVAGEFSDPIPAELINATWTCTASSVNSSCTASGTGDIVDNAVFLKAGEFVTYTLEATIDSSVVGDIINTATITIPGTVPLLSFSDSDTTTVVSETDLGIEITDLPTSTTSVAGENILYQIVVTNYGPSDAVGATVTVDAPVILTGVSWTCTPSAGSTCTPSQLGDINDTVNLKKNGTLVYALSATIDPATNETTLTVPAEVAFVGDTNPANDTDSDTNTLKKDYDIVVDKDSLNTEFIPGTPITYVLTITNDGPSVLTGGTVTDDFPDKLTGVTWTCVPTPLVGSSCAPTGVGNINDTVDMTVGGKVVYTVIATIKPDATGDLYNKVIFDSNDGIVKEDDHDVVLTPKTDLAATITNGVIELTPGMPVTYTMVVSNNGPSDVVGAIVTNNLPPTLLGALWTCSSSSPGASCGSGSGTDSINTTANLPVGGSVTYILTANVDSGAAGTLTDTITVDVPTGYIDTNNANNTDSDTDPLVAVNDVLISKTDGLTEAVPGSLNTYTIVVTNNGPSDIAGEFSDPIPAELLNATWTCVASTVDSACTASGTGDIIDNAVFFEPTEFVTYTLVATIDPAAVGDIINTATITIPGTVPLLTYSDSDTTTLVPGN